MYRPLENFRMRTTAADEPASDKVIRITQDVDILEDVGGGWVKVRAYDHNQVIDGFARREWLELIDDTKIDKVKFIQA